MFIQGLLTWFALGYGIMICLALMGTGSPEAVEQRKVAVAMLICIAMGPLVLVAIGMTLWRESRKPSDE